jgi:hypothetical protein
MMRRTLGVLGIIVVLLAGGCKDGNTPDCTLIGEEKCQTAEAVGQAQDDEAPAEAAQPEEEAAPQECAAWLTPEECANSGEHQYTSVFTIWPAHDCSADLTEERPAGTFNNVFTEGAVWPHGVHLCGSPNPPYPRTGSNTYANPCTTIVYRLDGFTVDIVSSDSCASREVFTLVGSGAAAAPAQNDQAVAPQPQQVQPQPAKPKVSINAWIDATRDDGYVRINGVMQDGTGPMLWDWGDGARTQSWFPAEHAYGQSGNYQVRISDANGEGTFTLPCNLQVVPAATPPQITNVVLRYDRSSGSLIIWQDVYFTDADLDSNQVEYALIWTSLAGVQTRNGSLNQAAADTYVTGKWGCGNRTYSVTLGATIVDKAGNRSNQYQYTMECN